MGDRIKMILVQIKDLVAGWGGCICSGACPRCVDRMTRIDELIEEGFQEVNNAKS